MAVVETIAVAANTQPLNSRPLYDAVDSDALNDLFRAGGDRPSPRLRVSFAYEGFDVTVTGSGEVTVRPVDGEFPV